MPFVKTQIHPNIIHKSLIEKFVRLIKDSNEQIVILSAKIVIQYMVYSKLFTYYLMTLGLIPVLITIFPT
jgi:hypothetical protein